MDNLGAVFVCVGSVVGAGFISGRELLSFFGQKGYLLPLFLSFLCFAFFCLVIGFIGRAEKDFSSLTRRVFHGKDFTKWLVYISSILSISVMLCVIDDLTLIINPTNLPLYSIAIFLVVILLSTHGNGVAKIINLILLPMIIAFTCYVSFTQAIPIIDLTLSFKPKRIITALLYSCMNVFINLPCISDVLRGKNKKSLVFIAVTTSIILGLFSLLILSVLSGHNHGLESSPSPFLTAVKTGGFLFNGVCLLGVITSLITAVYPLLKELKGSKNKYITPMVLGGCFVLSRLGVKVVIDFLYPLIGGLGLVFMIRCLIHLKNNRYKKFKFAENESTTIKMEGKYGKEKEKEQSGAFDRRTV